MRTPIVLILVLFFVSQNVSAQQKIPDKLKEKPITTAGGKVGDLLRQWWKEGTAAGNIGDIYDNRDRAHSDLDLGPYPQLIRYVYSAEDLKARRDWAGQRQLVPGVVFGNSSTSAPPTQGGSNPRMYYVSPAGLAFLYKQYTGNNVYIYPEHRDHDPGHNGRGDGFGDMYPTNTPYLFISQGSSGSDQPFMRAIPFTLAAFRPEVKKKLTEAGLLMPTLQMIFRNTYSDPAQRGKNPAQAGKDYLTARAHPTVFEGAWVDDLAMINLAHEMRADNVPPMIQLRVLQEDLAVPGQDFFDTHRGETLGNTPAVIARVVRGRKHERRMTVSAQDSYDLNKKPLTFKWVILRGDPERIKITPANKDASEVEITVAYHERRPIAPGAAMASNRVDIGVFVHNGTYWSAPGFITFFSLDNEARTCDEQGKVLEIGYGVGEANPTVADWTRFFEQALGDGLPAKLLNLKDEDRATLQKAQTLHKKLDDVVRLQRAKSKQVQDARDQAAKEEKAAKDAGDANLLAKKVQARELADKTLRAVQDEQNKAQQALNDLLEGRSKELPVSVRALTERYFQRLIQAPDQLESPIFTACFDRLTPAQLGAAAGLRKRLVARGIADSETGPKLALKPLRPGTPPRWTAYERAELERFQAALLAAVLFQGSVQENFQPNFVDQRLTVPRDWRDVYHYDAKDSCTGWTRFANDGKSEFTEDGLLITKKDELQRPVEARSVRYVLDPAAKFGPYTNALRQVIADTAVSIEYAGPEDRKGKRTSKQP